MEFANWLQTQWNAISAAPAIYIGTIIIVALAAGKYTRAHLGDEAAAAKERVEHYKQLVTELETDKSTLFSKLQEHGDDISAIKQELEKRPRIFVGPEKPKDAKDGDIWVQ